MLQDIDLEVLWGNLCASVLIPRSLLDWTAKQLFWATSSLQQRGVQSQRRANQCGLNHTWRGRGREQRGSNQVTQTRKSRDLRNVWQDVPEDKQASCSCHYVCWALATCSSQIVSVQFSLFSHSVMSNSLWPHGLQHTRLPCLSPTPRVCSNSCPLSRWCHPTISSSDVPFSSCPRSFPTSASFLMSRFFTSGDQSFGGREGIAK